MAKSAAAKSAAKKKNRKLKRQIRKTVGALLMVSAIAVAAVPVPDISANPADNTVIKVAVTDSREATNDFNGATAGYESEIPLATSTTPIYTSGEGMYQFAYIDEVAVILQYNGGYLEGNSVVIPDTIEGYKKYTDNTTRNDFCLVTKDGSFLAYRTQEQKIDANQQRVYTVPTIIDQSTGEQLVVVQNQLVLDPNGSGDFVYRETVTVPNPDPSGSPSTEYKYHKVSPVMEWKYNPCYYADRDKEGGWGTLKDAQLYWENRSVTPFEYQPAGGTDSKQRINADVAYLGVQTVEKDPATGSWELGDYITDPADGVFAGESNIVSVQMSENIRGIGDYAFYNCRNLEKVILNNGLQSIGNGVFAGCINIVECNIDVTARIRVIGKDAFYGCAALKSFTVPVAIEALGDSCFEGCTGLESIDFSGGGKNLALEKLGYHLFQGCSSLGAVEFPSTYRENDIDIDMFKGCSSLQKVVIQNEYTTVGEFHNGTSPYPTCSYTWEEFLEDVPDSFYFEGPDPSAIHESANENSAAFKYLGQDLYEKVMFEDEPSHDNHTDPDKPTAKITYQVNSTGELVKFEIEDGCKPDNVTIPETIGAYGITAIKAGSFNGNCDLSRVTIPASVTSIGDNAFRGCHRLSTVIFTDATTMTSIGTDAFKTQEGVSCTDALYDRDDPTGPEKPKLYFVGAMMDDAGQDTVPFMYAMNGSSNINNERQEKIWIICHSGWPTNLEVQYNRVTDDEPGESQLVGYPRYEMLENYVTEWVESLPYVTDKNKDEYIAMVQNATSGNNPTEMEMAVVRAALNVAIPNSVNSIKPGLFSGYSYYYDKDDTNHLYPLKARVDTEGKLYKDENGDGTSWVQITVNDKNELISGNGDGTPYPGDAAKQINTDEKIQSVTINGVDTIEPYTFAECPELLSADINGSKMLGDYAFDNCEKLATAKIGANLQDTGKRPFRGCGTLTQINCEESPVFSFDKSILYRSTGNGKEIVECLENRGLTGSYTITADELSGVTSLKPEAFAECKEIESIDMSNTTVEVIPEGCFKNMRLNNIIFPNTIGEIKKDAFVDNDARRLTVDFKNSNPPVIAQDAFKPLKPDKPDLQQVIFVCNDDSKSNPNIYGNNERYPYIVTTKEGWSAEFTVTFVNLPDWPADTNKEYITSQTVKAGSDAVPPTGEFKCKDEAYVFSGWSDYTNIQGDREVTTVYDTPKYTVKFQDGLTGEQIGEEQKVTRGWAATPPADDLIPQHEGYMFVGWEPAPTSILKDTTCIAKYVQNDGNMHTVTYCAYDGTVLTSYKVAHEENAPNIQGPVRDGYTFTGWMPAAYLTKVTEDRTVVATYQQGGGGNAGPNPSGGNGNGNNPNPSGGNGNNGNNNNANSSSSPKNSAAPTATPADGKDVPKYTVTVSGGSGTGSYPAGAVVAINAYAMGVGQVFDKWTSSTAGVGFADATATSTTFTMPAANVAITATYKTGGAGNAATNSSGGSGGGGGSSTGTVNNGSTVEVSKPGISNTNVAGATVTGATDNFVVKVSEDQAATDAATSALQARFGDLSRIKYFPMDISLYDSTGRTKIADTSGISVNLTLPLPDELIQYAGNNKMAAISGGALEDLNARFTTVGGVPCINFTATHFSPYVIYVDTANLTEATIDSTPKTGDPIHPKWFLAIGMACISLVLFFKRDKVVVKTKAA